MPPATCAGCRAQAPAATWVVFAEGPGSVARRRHCGRVQVRLVRDGRGRTWVDLSGVELLEVDAHLGACTDEHSRRPPPRRSRERGRPRDLQELTAAVDRRHAVDPGRSSAAPAGRRLVRLPRDPFPERHDGDPTVPLQRPVNDKQSAVSTC